MDLTVLLVSLLLLASMAWLGGTLVGVLLGSSIRRSGDSSAMGAFCMAFAQVAGPLFGGAALTTLATGIALVAVDGGPELGDGWVLGAIVWWLAAVILGATIEGRTWFTAGKELAGGATLAGTEALVAKATRLSWIDVALRAALVVFVVANVLG